jgi:hypothetical protein
MSDDAPNYGEAIMNAVSVEAKAVLAFMANVQKKRALSAKVETFNPEVAAETQKINLQVARSLWRQRKLLHEFLDCGEGTADDRTVAAEYLRHGHPCASGFEGWRPRGRELMDGAAGRLHFLGRPLTSVASA